MRSRLRLHPQGRPNRSAFTFIELMAVLAIILVVTAISVTASIQVIAYQRGNTTQTTLKTLSDSLDRQWAAVVDAAKQESLQINQNTNPAIYFLASDGTGLINPAISNQNIDKRARVIYIKMRLKQEFPMNFSEALYPGSLPPTLSAVIPTQLTNLPVEVPPRGSYGNYPMPFSMSPNQLPKGALRNFKIYVQAMNESPAIYPPTFNAGTTPYPASMNPAVWPIESSACALMSLQQARRGYALTEDDLGSGMVMTDPNTGIKFLVDAWQQPILFYRWPMPPPYGASPSDYDVDNSAPVGGLNPANTKSIFRDPLDPEGVLLDPDWNNASNYSTGHGVLWFELCCHSVHENWAPGQPLSNYQQRAYYTVPTFVSAGKNNKLGLVQPAITLPITLQPYPSPLLPDSMVIDQTNPQDSLDNIYSYRLRQGTRGD